MKESALGTKLLMLAVTICVLSYFVFQGLEYLSDPLTTTLAYEYQVEETVDLTGIVVRQETVLPDETSGLLQLQRAEGERVSTGGTVALVYADQASLDRQKEIEELTGRLEQLQFAQEAALSSDVTVKLDAQILQSLLDYRASIAANRLDKAEEYETNLRSLVLKRDYTYTGTEDLSGQISDLQTQIKSLRAQAASSVRRITAPFSGIYSAVVDGYEAVLTPEDLKTLTPSALSAVRPDEAAASNQVGKLIEGDAWYYAASMDTEQAAELEEAGTLTLRFTKGVERDLEVEVYAVGPEENGRAVVVFRGTKNLPQLTLLREQSAQIIRETASGIRIPQEALRAATITVDEEGNRAEQEALGVYCVVGMEARFKPVEVVYRGDSFVLVRSTAESNQERLRLRPGDEVIISATDLYDGKVVGNH